MREAICRENIRLASVDSHVRVTGIISAMPGYAYPLELSLPLEAKEILSIAISRDYQESPIWDWAGELLRAA
jgi:hypothetical protein